MDADSSLSSAFMHFYGHQNAAACAPVYYRGPKDAMLLMLCDRLRRLALLFIRLMHGIH